MNLEIFVTHLRLITAPRMQNDKQTMLRLLKELGAPIEGYLELNVKPGYEIMAEDKAYGTKFTFQKGEFLK